MADTDTTQSATPPAQPAAPSPAPEAAPAQPEAPAKTGDQAIQEGKGRPPGQIMSARDFNRAMGGGSSQTESLMTSESTRVAVPQNTTPTPAPTEPVKQPSEGAATSAETAEGKTGAAPEGEQRTKPNRAGEPQPIDEKGKYQSPGEKVEAKAEAETEPGAAAEAGASPEPETTPEEGSQPETETAATDQVPDGMVRIEIPEELQRNFGTHQDVPKEQEEFFRFNLNNRVRNSEVEKLRKESEEIAELRKQLTEARNKTLQSEVQTEATQKFKETPEYASLAEQYQVLKTAEEEGSVPEGTASRYWKDAALPAFKDFEQTVRTEKQQEYEAQEYERLEAQWKEQMWTRASALPQTLTELPGFRNEFDAAVDAFNFEVGRGRFDHLANDPDREQKLNESFGTFFHARLLSLYPAAREAIQRAVSAQQETRKSQDTAAQKAAEARAQREAEEARRREAEEAARNAATNPMGNVPSGEVYRDADGAQPKMNARQFDRVMSRRG